MLKGVKVGDKVVAFPYGIGTVVCIENDCIFNIQVEFKNPGGNTYTYTFSDEGKNVHWQDVIYCWTLNNAPSWIWENFERPMVTKPFEKWAVVNSTRRIQKLFDTNDEPTYRKRCPLCGCFIKLHTGDVHSCISCPFKCLEEDFDRVCAAMKTYASARKIAEWVIKRHRHTSACLDHDSLLFQCSCGYDEVEKFAKELLGDGGNNETQS